MMKTPRTEQAAFKVTRARTALIRREAFFGCLALHGKLQQRPDDRPDLDTMATDGRNFYYDVDFVLEQPERKLMGCFAHEVLHIADRHHTRRGNRDPEDWNISADYGINLRLVDAGFELPDGALIDQRYRGMGTEAIYALRQREKQAEQQAQGSGNGSQSQQPGQQAGNQNGNQNHGGQTSASHGQQGGSGNQALQGQSGGSSGQSGQAHQTSGQSGGGQPQAGSAAGQAQKTADPGRCGAVLDAAPDEAGRAEVEAETERNVRQAVMYAKAAGRGTIPAHLRETMAVLDKPKNDWRGRLRRYADDSSQKDYSWTKPNRRHMASGLIMPGWDSIGPAHLVALVDASGSMEQDALHAITTELQGMLDENAIDRLTVIYFNSKVTRIDSFSAGDIIETSATPSGGTDFAPAFAALEELQEPVTIVVCLTDLDCPSFGPEPACPVLWCKYGNEDRTPPWGEVIEIDPYDA